MKMNRIASIFAFGFVVTILTSCGINQGNGELVGSLGRKPFKQYAPYGMVYIPNGSFHMGQNDQDIAYSMVAPNRQVTVSSFWMDDTEITNNEYRQFVDWTRDSIAHKLIGGDHIFTTEDGKEFINWRKRIRYADPDNQEALADLYYTEEDRVFGKKDFDVRKFIYHAEWFDFKEASVKSNRDKPRSTFIKKDDVPIYPDTLVWLHDFTYAQNEPMVEKYFWHPAFDNYPVVGVTWRQARGFCIWRTRLIETFSESIGEAAPNRFELPTEAQFEYASRGGRRNADFPWGGPYIRNSRGCLLANFKPGRGNYWDDGGSYTVKSTSYFPNDYGLYNMSGNVAEWTSTAYDESALAFVHDLNPTYTYEPKDDEPEVMKRKTIKGGSWKDIGYYIQNGSRSYEYLDTPKAYVGFRCVMAYLGRAIEDEK
jgi:formylglycine-generating enzyme